MTSRGKEKNGVSLTHRLDRLAQTDTADLARQALRGGRRIVVKVGSALLVEEKGLRASWLKSFCAEIARYQGAGIDMIVVSSGAVGLGRRLLGWTGAAKLKLPQAQAAAAAGQISLIQSYGQYLSAHGLTTAQILLTLKDTENRRGYINARATINTLLRQRALPIINENDTVATSGIRYGDNDRLAARVAAMIGADCLILLSDIDGLYSADPGQDPRARAIGYVRQVTAEIEAMAGAAQSSESRGGMRTKIEAAKIATAAGASMIIANGRELNPLTSIENGARATVFAPHSTPLLARKAWISGQLELAGRLTVDGGAAKALSLGKSLLAAGVVKIDGNFSRGDAVGIIDENDQEIGRGLIAYDHDEAARIIGKPSQAIAEILGYERGAAIIHRDDLVFQQNLV